VDIGRTDALVCILRRHALAHRAVWDAQALTDYSYEYELTGFNIK